MTGIGQQFANFVHDQFGADMNIVEKVLPMKNDTIGNYRFSVISDTEPCNGVHVIKASVLEGTRYYGVAKATLSPMSLSD